MQPAPYRSSPIFTVDDLPDAFRRSHSTKAGVWGLLKVLKGSLIYTVENASGCVLKAPATTLIHPQQLHSVAPLDDMVMQVDFYHERPNTAPITSATSPT